MIIDNNILKCRLCGFKSENKISLSRHVNIKHMISLKEYYDLFYKKAGEEICSCGNIKNFCVKNFSYSGHCSTRCSRLDPKVIERCKRTCLKKYGVESPMQFSSVIKKKKATCLKKYGVESPMQSSVIMKKYKKTCIDRYGVDNISKSKLVKKKKKKTCLANYGVDNPSKSIEINQKKEKSYMSKYGFKNPNQSEIIKKQKKSTCLKKYGVECPLANNEIIKRSKKTLMRKYGVKNASQSKLIKDKKEQTCLRNHGVRYPSQNREILDKQHKSALQSKPYVLPSGKIIYIMGYEPRFLDYVFKNRMLKEKDIDYRPKTILYIGIDKKEHYYHPDFFIKKWNLIIEIKSKRTIELDLDVYNKEKYTKKSGFDYMRIVNNKFAKFNRYFNRKNKNNA